jgi:hypothetical protein
MVSEGVVPHLFELKGWGDGMDGGGMDWGGGMNGWMGEGAGEMDGWGMGWIVGGGGGCDYSRVRRIISRLVTYSWHLIIQVACSVDAVVLHLETE